MKYGSCVLVLSTLLAACQASWSVKPIASDLTIRHVCIEENDKVVVSDFLPVLRDAFDRHGISTETYRGSAPTGCEYKVSYTANQRWELSYGTFLSHAEIRIEKEGRFVAAATFNVGAGFNSAKSKSTKDNIDPVIDEMLKNK